MKTVTLIFLALFFTVPIQAQKVKLPKGWLIQQEAQTPDMYRFKGNTLMIKTDPVLNYGFQYTNVYKLNWANDSTFTLVPKRNYRKDNNRERTRRKRISDAWHFDPPQRPYWVISKGEGDSYHMRTSQHESGAKAEGDLSVVWIPMN